MGICEYEATLSYIARLKPARTTKGALVSKKKKLLAVEENLTSMYKTMSCSPQDKLSTYLPQNF